jgi:hypothetical protein
VKTLKPEHWYWIAGMGPMKFEFTAGSSQGTVHYFRTCSGFQHYVADDRVGDEATIDQVYDHLDEYMAKVRTPTPISPKLLEWMKKQDQNATFGELFSKVCDKITKDNRNFIAELGGLSQSARLYIYPVKRFLEKWQVPPAPTIVKCKACGKEQELKKIYCTGCGKSLEV